jgi:hypothetical protein
MVSVNSLLEAINERTIAQRIGIPHDEARARYPLRSNTVDNFGEFSDVIGDYCNYHVSTCVTHGGYLSSTEATGRAKELLEREYRRRQGDIVTAFNDAHDGTNGGLRSVLDKLADGLKAESVERYVREMFDRHVARNSWEEKVAIIRQFIDQCGAYLSSSIETHQPERYAHDYEELIRVYVAALQRSSSVFRRL